MVVSQQASEHVALFVMFEDVYEEMNEAGIFWGTLCVYPVLIIRAGRVRLGLRACAHLHVLVLVHVLYAC